MKKALLSIICLFMVGAAYAGTPDYAKLDIRITDPVKNNTYFLCVYGVGCLSIEKGDQGKPFIMPAMDMGNILKFVITDVDNMQIFMQPTVNSCNVQVNNGQTLTISGQLIVKNSIPSIKDLRCHVTG